MRISATILLSALLLGGCASLTPDDHERPIPIDEAPPPAWARIAEAEDLDRLDQLPRAWSAALAEARSARFGWAVAEEGELLDPEAALPRPELPPGPYRCRVIKLGRGQGGGRAFVSHPPSFCHVADAGELLAFTKQTGSERPGGYLYPDRRPDRLIFLGAVALGGEPAPLGYGERRARDLAGVVERVAPFRWRLLLPWPPSGSTLEVMELVPALP